MRNGGLMHRKPPTVGALLPLHRRPNSLTSSLPGTPPPAQAWDEQPLDRCLYFIFARNAPVGSSFPLLNRLHIWLILGSRYSAAGTVPAGKPLSTWPASRVVAD